MLACVILIGVVFFFVATFQCKPVSGFWGDRATAQCLDGPDWYVTYQIFNIILDFGILAMPMPMIWGLHRSWQDRAALMGVFLLGGL